MPNEFINRRLSKVRSLCSLEPSSVTKQNSLSSKIPRSLNTKTIFTSNNRDIKLLSPSVEKIVESTELDNKFNDLSLKNQQQLAEMPKVFENSTLKQLTYVLSQLCDGNMNLNNDQLIDVVYLWSKKIKRGSSIVLNYIFYSIYTSKTFRFISKISQIHVGLIVVHIFVIVVNCIIFRYKCF